MADSSGTQAASADQNRRSAEISILPQPHASVTHDRYVIGEVIAKGGMGAVHFAHDQVLQREIAIKLLHESLAHHAEARKRFDDEATITSQLQHPNIPPIHDLGTLPDGRPFLAMKLIRGNTLDQLLKQRTDPSVDRGQFLLIFEAICQAVGYAHNQGIIHRDLKPLNVMVGAFGEVQVMDWGLAKQLQHRHEPPHQVSSGTAGETQHWETAHTQAGSIMGTPAYMAPEQARGEIDVICERSDVFGLGGILCVILTGQPPFVASDAETTHQLAATANLTDAFARLDRCNADSELIGLAKRCLAAERSERLANGTAVANELIGIRTNAEATAKRRELAAARRRVWQGSGLALLATIVGGLWWLDHQRATQRIERERLLTNQQQAATQRTNEIRRDAEVAIARVEQALREENWRTSQRHLDETISTDWPNELRDHLARLAADTETLRLLDHVADDSLWPPIRPTGVQVQTYPSALMRFGFPADPARLNDSLIRNRVIGGFDEWLGISPDKQRRQTILQSLKSVDDNPLLMKVRTALAEQNRERLSELAQSPDVQEWPERLTAAVGRSKLLPPGVAVELLRTAVVRYPRSVPILLAAAKRIDDRNTRANTDDILKIEGVSYAQAALALHPNSVAACTRLGSLLTQLKSFQRGLAYYRMATELAPDDAQTWYFLGNRLTKSGDFSAARDAYQNVVSLTPMDPEFNLYRVGGLQGLVSSNTMLRDQKEAIRYAKLLAAIEPRRPDSIVVLGQVYVACGQFEEALKWYKQLPLFYPQKAKLLSDLERMQSAEAYARMAKEQARPLENPNHSLLAAEYCTMVPDYLTAYQHFRDGLASPDITVDARIWFLGAETAVILSGERLPPSSGFDRATLQSQALKWAQKFVDVASAEINPKLTDEERQGINTKLKLSLNSRLIAPVQHPLAVGHMPPPQRDAWRKVWADVRTLIAKTERP